jgi:protein O-mannosyl-transferase
MQPAPERQSRTQSPTYTSPFFTPRNQFFVLGFLLAIATVAVYYPVAKLPFTSCDDQVYVYENVNVISGLHWETVRWAFTSYDGANWHPLTWLSHALDC